MAGEVPRGVDRRVARVRLAAAAEDALPEESVEGAVHAAVPDRAELAHRGH